MKEKLPGLFRPLMKFNVTAVMVIILMFSVFNVFSIVRTQQRQASLQTMALSQASQQIGDFIASAEQLGIVVQNDSQLMAYNLYNNRDLPHNIVWELEMLAPSVNSLSSLSIVYVDSLYPQINGVIYSSAGRFSYADYCRDELSGSLTENQLMEVVYAADHAHFVPQLSGNTRSLLYVMPIPSSYVFSPGRLLLRLDYTSFTRGLRATAAGNSDIYVFDSEENLLLYFGPTYGNDITAARAAAVGPESLSGKAVFRHELENYGIQVVQALDFWQYYQPTLTAVLSLVLLAAFVTVSGLRLSYVLAQNTARPFSVLVQRASQLGGVTPAEEPDEIARLSHIFEDLVEQQTSLTAAMESHSQLEESQYLLYLLGVLGGRDFSETVVQKYSTLLSRWSRFGLRVLVFRFDDTIHFVETYLPKQQWSIKSALRQEFAAMCGAQDGFGAAVDLQNGQGIAAVAAFGPDADCACILDAIREALCRSCGLSLSCGISSAVYAAGDLPHAFREASANCRYRLFHANSTITPEFVADIRNQRTRLSYTGADDILQAVKACSYPDISRGVGRFFADITRAATLPSYKLAYFDMLSRLNKLIPECAENKQTMLVNMLDLLYENCYESTEVLQQDLYKFCILLADTLYEQRSAQLSGGLLGTIYDYVEENYAQPYNEHRVQRNIRRRGNDHERHGCRRIAQPALQRADQVISKGEHGSRKHRIQVPLCLRHRGGRSLHKPQYLRHKQKPQYGHNSSHLQKLISASIFDVLFLLSLRCAPFLPRRGKMPRAREARFPVSPTAGRGTLSACVINYTGVAVFSRKDIRMYAVDLLDQRRCKHLPWSACGPHPSILQNVYLITVQPRQIEIVKSRHHRQVK